MNNILDKNHQYSFEHNKNYITENIEYTCCFLGHRKIIETENLKCSIYKTVDKLIKQHNVHIFLFGSKSEFNNLCLKIVSNLKEKYPHIKRVYIRAEYADIDNNYIRYLLEKYDETYFPEKIRGAGKASYVERNKEMIDKSKFCVVYYDEKYFPQTKKNRCKNPNDYHPKSGTKIAYDYAIRKGVKIINTINI